jgi:hypothetical protein
MIEELKPRIISKMDIKKRETIFHVSDPIKDPLFTIEVEEFVEIIEEIKRLPIAEKYVVSNSDDFEKHTSNINL